MGANTHYDYISSRGGGSSLTSGHAELVSASHNKEIPKHLTASPTDTGSHNSCLVGSLCKVRNDKYVSEAHSKELNVLTSYRLNDFKKKVAFTLAEGATQRICTRTERSEFVPASKTTLFVHNPRHVDMSDSFGKAYFCHCEERSDVAIATPANNNEIPEQVRNDEYSYANKIKHGIVPLALRDDVNNAITTSDLRPPRNDRKELNDFKKNAAFTLAEVLITLAIIGVVAAMTIPTLVANYQNKAWQTSSEVFERKLEEALKTMNTQQTLAGYSNTADFVAELGKHFKITKVCQNDDIMSCFEDKVTWGDEEVDMTKVKNAKNFGQDEWDTELIGVQFGNGTSGIIAYNPDCKEQPFSNQFSGTSCLALLYDTDGFKKPNTQQKDLRSINVLSLGGSNCAFKINGTCFTAPFSSTPLTLAECEAQKGDLGISECYRDPDSWAGAVKACGGVNKMPTRTQLADIANYVYNTSGIGGQEDVYDLTLDNDKVAELGFTTFNSGYFYVWSGEEKTLNYAYYRSFFPTSTEWDDYYPRGNTLSDFQTICLGD